MRALVWATLATAALVLASCSPSSEEPGDVNVINLPETYYLVDEDFARPAGDDRHYVVDLRSTPERPLNSWPPDDPLHNPFEPAPCFMPGPGDPVPDCLRTDR